MTRLFMRSSFAIAIGLVVALVGMFVLGGIRVTLSSGQATLAAGKMVRGRVHPMLFEKLTWTSPPVGPWSSNFYDVWAIVLMTLLIGGVAVAVRLLRRRTWMPVAWASLALGLVPYVMGMAVLSPNRDPARAAAWVHTMVCGLVYGGLACAVFGIVHRIRGRSRTATGAPGLETCHACGKAMEGHGGATCPHCGALRLLSD